MTMANQQLNVQLQQFLETLETVLRTARIELEEQVQNATSTTTHKDPMMRAGRLFKLRSYLGGNEMELTMTEESSTPRHIRALSMLMHYILVMMKTLYRCHNAGVNEGFARKSVRERIGAKVCWTPKERVILQTQRRRETVIDDIMTDVNVLRMEGRASCLIWESTGIASCFQARKENLEITRTQQYIDSNLMLVQIGVQPKSKGKSKHGRDARKKSSEKVKDDDQRECYHCREAGRAKSRSRTRLKDLADAEWKPVTTPDRVAEQRMRRW